jgi:hypothetical protein
MVSWLNARRLKVTSRLEFQILNFQLDAVELVRAALLP